MKNSRFTLYRIVIIGLMAAMVFVCTMFLGIRIPTPTGRAAVRRLDWRPGGRYWLRPVRFDLS